MNRVELEQWIQDEYGAKPEHLWKEYPDYVVYRHEDNDKWFALVMDVDGSKLGPDVEGKVDVVDLKAHPDDIDALVHRNGFFRGYHMNKKDWISVLLGSDIEDDEIKTMIETSYELTS